MNSGMSDHAPLRGGPRSLRWLAARARTLAIAYFSLLFAATHWPLPPGAIPQGADKLYHFGAYGLLAFLVLAGWELSIKQRLEPKHFFAVWLAGAAYGVVDELTQIPVGRSADPRDWLADVVGVVCGVAAYLAIRAIVGPAAHRLLTSEAPPQ